MDKIDRKILQTLHGNARITNPLLAEKVGLSTSPCWSRVRRMEKEGVIQQYVTVINQDKIGLPDTAIIEIMFERHDATIFSEFEKSVAGMPEVIEAYLLTGEYDCFMKVAVAGTKGYQDFLLNKLYKVPGIKNTRSSLTLRCFKQAFSAAP
ncbi:MAG: Lrp/AsnC family leucine-responsive transcriptional regulator [Gammaproteobacteria bacterium]|jgi:Lrp/AsnC family leucine-responsive transcriptional regulator